MTLIHKVSTAIGKFWFSRSCFFLATMVCGLGLSLGFVQTASASDLTGYWNGTLKQSNATFDFRMKLTKVINETLLGVFENKSTGISGMVSGDPENPDGLLFTYNLGNCLTSFSAVPKFNSNSDSLTLTGGLGRDCNGTKKTPFSILLERGREDFSTKAVGGNLGTWLLFNSAESYVGTMTIAPGVTNTDKFLGVGFDGLYRPYSIAGVYGNNDLVAFVIRYLTITCTGRGFGVFKNASAGLSVTYDASCTSANLPFTVSGFAIKFNF